MKRISNIVSAVTILAMALGAASSAYAAKPKIPAKNAAAVKSHSPAEHYVAPSSPGFLASAEVCGSLLMPAAALKQVSRGFSASHSGIDLMAPYGSPIRAASAGRVIFAGVFFGYGNMVDIERDDGLVTRYGHMSTFSKDTTIGHRTAIGDVIGQIGTSGHAHGPHVHFEVRIGGHAVNPAPYLALSNCPTGSGRTIEEARAPDLSSGRSVVTEGRPGGVFQ